MGNQASAAAANNGGKGEGKSRFEEKLEEYNKFKRENASVELFRDIFEQIDGINVLYNTAFDIHQRRQGRAGISGNANTQEQMIKTAAENVALADKGVKETTSLIDKLASVTTPQKRVLTRYLSSMQTHYHLLLAKATRTATRAVKTMNRFEAKEINSAEGYGLNTNAAAARAVVLRAAAGTNAAMNAAAGKGAGASPARNTMRAVRLSPTSLAALRAGLVAANAGKGKGANAGKVKGANAGKGHEGGRRKTRKGRKGTRKGRKGTRKGRKGSRKGNRRH